MSNVNCLFNQFEKNLESKQSITGAFVKIDGNLDSENISVIQLINKTHLTIHIFI